MHLDYCMLSLHVAERFCVFTLTVDGLSVLMAASERVTHILMVPTSSEITTDAFSSIMLTSVKKYF